ncbi:hypothetical protein [Hymenobacter volaticus]|uniref:Uncharacterized protein n=1 Tax=Hymenobacter volaticus TaxID=2932254 RepID=A0ABY4G6D2_9BACT|nr:hypothetical protein [Hymenobacter volaticus]UOQ66464.1 hypothetical protein MUN86_00570 [Hymenobacter volaticus]
MPLKMVRPVLLWLLVSLVLAVLLAGISLGFGLLLQPQLDIQLHNTYFVVQPLLLIGVLFLLLLLVFGFLMLLRSQYPLQTYLLLAAVSALLIGIVTLLISSLTTSGMVGWTVYPPLNATDSQLTSSINPYQLLLNGAYAVQLLAVTTLGYSCYRVGKLAASH